MGVSTDSFEGLDISTSSLGGSQKREIDEEDEMKHSRTTYYKEKFSWDIVEHQQQIDHLRNSYLEGTHPTLLGTEFVAIYWICNYYFHGCVSWSWFFPYHYTPMASGMALCLRS